jgi:hypothetical protein
VVEGNNVVTQGLNIGDQLRRDSRYFDIRPVVGNGGQYLTDHYNISSKKLRANDEPLGKNANEVNK